MANEARKIQMAQVKLQKSLQDFVTVIGVEAKKHFVASFRNQGFTDATLDHWKARKRNDKGKRGNRAILVKSGDLRRSVKVINKNYDSVTLGSDLPYAQIHNDGGTIHKKASKNSMYYREVSTNILSRKTNKRFARTTGRRKATHAMEVEIGEHDIKMPKRQFIGNSKKLTDLLRDKLDKRIQNVFR
jgi:phage gpG-like protein